MWRASTGTTTFSGAYALMLARGIQELADRLQEVIDFEEEDDEFRVGHRAFDCLTFEQKIWTLHKVAHGLLDKKTPACELTAFLEATVACIFRALEDSVMIEIDTANELDESEECLDDNSYDRFFWRKTILNAYQSRMEEDSASDDNKNDEDEEDDEEIERVTVECENEDEWNFVIECLENDILWDGDYDLEEFDDMAPDNASLLKQLFRIDDAYFSSIPEDPSRSAALDLLKATNKLCNKIIKREEKHLKEKSL
ncbi:MAG: hypothetical protein LBP87_12085 [Planctomycetaceae bacterium]|jgi:hypothetical protein|nr:hypothetical protein [Planctomycetaceae bacterium]